MTRVLLVKDHERCLWQETKFEAEKKSGFDSLLNFPKCSPDLNASEGWWKRLKDKLAEGAPTVMEARPAFLTRLRRIVTWLNRNAWNDCRALCWNQKERARDVIRLKGARRAW